MGNDLETEEQEQVLKCENVQDHKMFHSNKKDQQEGVDKEEGSVMVDVIDNDNVYLQTKTIMRRQRARRVARYIEQEPQYTCFKPAGVPRSRLESVKLLVEEYEAIRLADIEDLSMQVAAEQMKVSAATFNRMLQLAHKKIAEAIVHGKEIKIYPWHLHK